MEFSTGVWSQLLNDVVDHRLDGAIIAVSNEHPDIERMELYQEELVLIASPSAGEIHRPQDLTGKNLFMWPEGCPYRSSLENWLVKHGVASTLTSIASYGTILGCVSSGAGVSLVPRGIYEHFRRIGGISGYWFSDLLPLKNYFIWNKNVNFHHAKDKFAELLMEEFKSI